MDKHMKFDEGAENNKILVNDQLSTKENIAVFAEDRWTKLFNKIMALDTETLKAMHSHVQMQNMTNDFLTKLDLIEKYPQLFVNNKG